MQSSSLVEKLKTCWTAAVKLFENIKGCRAVALN